VADHDGPDAIRRHAQRKLPEVASDIERIAGDYARLRFGGGNPDDARELAALKERIRAISRATGSRRQRTSAAG
jgi:hypothetical protein